MSIRPIFLTAVLLAFTSIASAETQLNHGAGFCQKSGSSGTLTRYFQGTVGNSHSSQDLRLLCPMVRVAAQDTTGVAKVHVIDKNRDEGIKCSFYNQRSYGHTWSWSGWVTTKGSGPTNYRTFSWGPNSSQDKFEGFHHVHCILPPADTVYGASILGSYSSGG